MKKTMILMLCALLGVVTMQSCKKDDKKKTSSTSTNTNEFSLTVDGIDVDPSTIIVQESGGVVTCTGMVDTNTSYSLYVDELLEPGTYSIDGNTEFEVLHSDDNNATFYSSSSGSVTILVNDTVNNAISGTFNCTLTRFLPPSTKTVTDGQFSIHYQQ